MILDQLFTADSLAESVPGQTRTPYDIGGADAWYHRGSHPEQFDNDEDRAEYLRGYQDEGVTGRHQGKQYDLDETNSLTTRAADPRIQDIGRRMIELNQLYAQAQRMKDHTLVNKIKQALSRLAAEKLRLQGTAPADMAEGLDTGDDNREYHDDKAEWKQAVTQAGGGVWATSAAGGKYLARGWDDQVFGEFDPATGHGWIVRDFAKQGMSEDSLNEISKETAASYFDKSLDKSIAMTDQRKAAKKAGDLNTVKSLDAKFKKMKSGMTGALKRIKGVAEDSVDSTIDIRKGKITQDGQQVGTVMQTLKHGYHPIYLLKLNNGFSREFEMDTPDLKNTLIKITQRALSARPGQLDQEDRLAQAQRTLDLYRDSYTPDQIRRLELEIKLLKARLAPKQDVAEGLSEPTRKVFFKVIKTQGTGMPSGYRRVKTMRPLEDGGFYIELSTPGYGMDYTRHNYKNFSLKDDQGKPITGQEANNIINGKQGVTEAAPLWNPYDPTQLLNPLNPMSPVWVGKNMGTGAPVDPESIKILYNTLVTMVSIAVAVGVDYVANNFMEKSRLLAKGALEVDAAELKSIQQQIKYIYGILNKTKKPATKLKYEQMLKDAYAALEEIKSRTDMKGKGQIKPGVAEGSATQWEVSFDYGPHMSETVKVKAGSEEEAIAKVEKAAEKRGRSIMINWAKPAGQGMAEATGDVKFDKMLKGITAKKAVAKQRKADTQQQARDAFGGMFGGGNPADKLGLGKKDVSEAQPTRRTMPWSVWNAKSADDQRFIRSQYPDLVITDRPRPKSPAAPKKEKIDYAEIARKIQEIVGNTFPDGDPIDWLIPYMRRRWGQEYNIGQHLDRAARRHLGARDYTDYLAQMWDQVADDDLMPDHVTHDNNPWRAREGMAEAKADPLGAWIAHKNGTEARRFKTREGAKKYAASHEGFTVNSSEGFHDTYRKKKVQEVKKFRTTYGWAGGSKEPRSAHAKQVAAKRKEYEKGLGKFEPTDDMVGTAKMIKDIATSNASPEHKKAAIDALNKKGVAEGRWFRTSYGWAGGRNEKTGKMYKHPELYKKAQDKRAKRDAESGAVDKPEKDTALSETKLVGIMRHPEHGKAYIWHKGGEGGHNYEVEHARTKQKETHHKSHEEVVAGLKKQGYRLDESDLERFHKSLGQQIRDRVAQTQADVAIARAKDPGTWQWNKGDQVYSKKTGKVYTIQGQTMNPKFGAMYWYQRGREGRNGFERGQFIASLAHETLTKVNEDALSESEQYHVLYIDGRAVAKYKETHQARADLERLQSKFPQKNIELKSEMLEAAVAEGLRDPADNPCWKGYYPVGTKKKNGRTVPNCVPKK